MICDKIDFDFHLLLKKSAFNFSIETVGKKINEAKNTYETALKQLSTGRGNVIGKIEELKKMGANAS